MIPPPPAMDSKDIFLGPQEAAVGGRKALCGHQGLFLSLIRGVSC